MHLHYFLVNLTSSYFLKLVQSISSVIHDLNKVNSTIIIICKKLVVLLKHCMWVHRTGKAGNEKNKILFPLAMESCIYSISIMRELYMFYSSQRLVRIALYSIHEYSDELSLLVIIIAILHITIFCPTTEKGTRKACLAVKKANLLISSLYLDNSPLNAISYLDYL